MSSPSDGAFFGLDRESIGEGLDCGNNWFSNATETPRSASKAKD